MYWHASSAAIRVTGATGYRVIARSTASSGPFATSAGYDVANGTSVKSTGVSNVFLGRDDNFVYVEAIPAGATSPQRYF